MSPTTETLHIHQTRSQANDDGNYFITHINSTNESVRSYFHVVFTESMSPTNETLHTHQTHSQANDDGNYFITRINSKT